MFVPVVAFQMGLAVVENVLFEEIGNQNDSHDLALKHQSFGLFHSLYAVSGQAVGVASIICVTLRERVLLSWSTTAIGMSRATPLYNNTAKNANATIGRITVSSQYIG